MIIALLLQSKRNEAMRGCFGFRRKKDREWGRMHLIVLGKGQDFVLKWGEMIDGK